MQLQQYAGTRLILAAKFLITVILLGMIAYGWIVTARTGDRVANWEAAVIGAIVGYWLNDGETVATRLQESDRINH